MCYFVPHEPYPFLCEERTLTEPVIIEGSLTSLGGGIHCSPSCSDVQTNMHVQKDNYSCDNIWQLGEKCSLEPVLIRLRWLNRVFATEVSCGTFAPAHCWRGITTAKGGCERRTGLPCIFPVGNFNSVKIILVLSAHLSGEAYGPTFGGQL